jgi:hypothetical protein
MEEAVKPLIPLLEARARGDYDTKAFLDAIGNSLECLEAATTLEWLMDKEKRLLAEHGVDWRPYRR